MDHTLAPPPCRRRRRRHPRNSSSSELVILGTRHPRNSSSFTKRNSPTFRVIVLGRVTSPVELAKDDEFLSPQKVVQKEPFPNTLINPAKYWSITNLFPLLLLDVGKISWFSSAPQKSPKTEVVNIFP